MNASTSPRLDSPIIERVMQEHDALHAKIHRIHSVLSGPMPDEDEIESLLREFLSTLVVHFAAEEEDEGFFTEVTKRDPTLVTSAAKLGVEHRDLLQEANELCQFAGAGCPSMLWWRELQTRCHEFNKRLMQHECQENKLLHEAHKNDARGYD
jgi:hypothetical protein